MLERPTVQKPRIMCLRSLLQFAAHGRTERILVAFGSEGPQTVTAGAVFSARVGRLPIALECIRFTNVRMHTAVNACFAIATVLRRIAFMKQRACYIDQRQNSRRDRQAKLSSLSPFKYYRIGPVLSSRKCTESDSLILFIDFG